MFDEVFIYGFSNCKKCQAVKNLLKSKGITITKNFLLNRLPRGEMTRKVVSQYARQSKNPPVIWIDRGFVHPDDLESFIERQTKTGHV